METNEKSTINGNINHPTIDISLKQLISNSNDKKAIIALKNTFETLFNISKDDRPIVDYMTQLYQFYISSQKIKDAISMYEIKEGKPLMIDDHIFMLLHNPNNQPFTNHMIIGFIPYHVGINFINIQWCIVKHEYRRKNIGSTMINSIILKYLDTPHNTSIEYIKANTRSTYESIRFMLRLGFILEYDFSNKQNNTNEFKKLLDDGIKTNKPIENILQILPFSINRNPDGSIILVRLKNNTNK